MESIFLTDLHILFCIDVLNNNSEFEYLLKNFCGVKCLDFNSFKNNYKENSIIYFCGDAIQLKNYPILPLNMNIVTDFSYNYNDINNISLISFDKVPINVHDVGVYFRNFFNNNLNYFDLVNNSHEFQTLTESNKPSNAFRTGIYLTQVSEEDNKTKFNLLRCSSNLSGPTVNFSDVDNEIVKQVNDISKFFFKESANFNHVLAQIYTNITEDHLKEHKSKIKEHSDKTKDMPPNGLMAFCTFYKDLDKKSIKKSKLDSCDYVFNTTSVLTKLRFRLKSTVIDKLVDKFDIILYPNSVFIMSLKSNRLYTHEIIPSVLPIDKIPVRMGYVIRCSKTKAIHENDQTYIVEDDLSELTSSLKLLVEPTEDKIKELKKLYFEENTTDNLMNYGKFYFSFNKGDYSKPISNKSLKLTV